MLGLKAVKISFQALPLGSDGTLLADSGLSNESTLEVTHRPEPPAELWEELKMAREALGNITKFDIYEIKSFMKPPQAVEDAFCVLLLMSGSQDTDWKATKEKLARTMLFVEQIREADPEELYNRLTSPKTTVGEIRAKFEAVGDTLHPDHMKRISSAMSLFCRWIQAAWPFFEFFDKYS
eukprot:Hpha_TRINITY_DN14043_c0_g1::TRINITY_DN14043_c0_g1_i2::g.44111::m.44111